MAPKTYTSKAILSGHIIEIYEYERPILEGFTDTKKDGLKGRASEANEEDRLKNREKVLSRAKQTLRRLINANVHRGGIVSKFVTLTFRDHITSIQDANYEFEKFVKRLKYELGCKIQYAIVPEFTKIGRIHYHVVMFNIPYIPNAKLAGIWGNGFIKINNIDQVDNVGAYVTKYMTKPDPEKEDKLQGKKCYFTSRGLIQPLEIKEEEEVKQLATALPHNTKTYTATFDNDFQGTIQYTQYNLKRVEIEIES